MFPSLSDLSSLMLSWKSAETALMVAACCASSISNFSRHSFVTFTSASASADLTAFSSCFAASCRSSSKSTWRALRSAAAAAVVDSNSSVC